MVAHVGLVSMEYMRLVFIYPIIPRGAVFCCHHSSRPVLMQGISLNAGPLFPHEEETNQASSGSKLLYMPGISTISVISSGVF